jgi:multiple sugar transport system permease protein
MTQNKRNNRRLPSGYGVRFGSPAAPYLLLSPALIIIIVVLILPIFYAIKLSCTDAQLLAISHANWVGLKNYLTFFSSASLGKVLFATFIYVVLGVSLTYLIGLGTASLLNMPLKGRGLFRVILILPWVIPQVVLVLIWKWMLNPQYGVVNWFLINLNLTGEPVSWFTDARFALIAILLVTIWKQYPLGCLILLAGMKTIPAELYEAAEIDGAGKWQRFLNITLPGLRYVSSVLILLLVIWSFTNFVIIWMLTMGGPADRTATLSIYTYLNAFKFNKLGYGAAIGVVCLLVSLLFSIIYYRKVISNNG